jgi:hypothetical protein
MFTQSDQQIEKFFSDSQWVAPGQTNDNVSFDTLYAHYCKWTRAHDLPCVTGDHFFTVCAVAHTGRLGLIRIQSAGVVLFEQMSLLMYGKVVDVDRWPDFDHEQSLIDCISDTSVFERGIKKRLLRARFYTLYTEWCKSKAYPVLGKIRLFEILTTSTRVQQLCVHLGYIYGKHIVVRGLDEVGEL